MHNASHGTEEDLYSEIRNVCTTHFWRNCSNTKHRDGQVKAYFSYLGEVDWSVFPALEEVQALGCKWPLNE